MSTTPPAAKTAVHEPPVPTTRTVVVGIRPPLIPDENAYAFCLTRRNIFDTVIALMLVVGIIYLVFYWRRGARQTMNTGFGQGTGARSARGVGQQIAGAFKRFFK